MVFFIGIQKVIVCKWVVLSCKKKEANARAGIYLYSCKNRRVILFDNFNHSTTIPFVVVFVVWFFFTYVFNF